MNLPIKSPHQGAVGENAERALFQTQPARFNGGKI